MSVQSAQVFPAGLVAVVGLVVAAQMAYPVERAWPEDRAEPVAVAVRVGRVFPAALVY